MDKKFLSVFFSLLFSLFLVIPALSAPPEFNPICHFTDDVDKPYVLLNLPEKAYQVHLAHGDPLLGDPVPGMPGYIFDAECIPEMVAVDVSGIWRGYSDEPGGYWFDMTLTQDTNGDVNGIAIYDLGWTSIITGSVTGNEFTFVASPLYGVPFISADCTPCTVETVQAGDRFSGYGSMYMDDIIVSENYFWIAIRY